jgi:hypothetical protein
VSATPATSLARYLRHRRAWEVGLWTAYWLLNAAANSVIANIEIARRQLDFETWEPVVWEFSSCLVLLTLVPAVILFERRFPLRPGTWRRNLPWHLAATVVCSLVHVAAMVGLRKVAYAAAGEYYSFGDWPRELLYEYLKDVRTYAIVLAVVAFYRLLLLRLQGEARLLSAPDVGPPVEPVERPERFLVRKLGAEFLVAARDIEWLEASENYVNLHVRGQVYPLRSTMAALQERLDAQRFRRVHRSYMINLEHLDRIEPLDTGDARLWLKDGTRVPCSRRYRAALREQSAVVTRTGVAHEAHGQ